MTVEGVIAMQACARIGATHSVVFGGFSSKALEERINDAGAVAVVTANYQMRGGKELPLKSIVDEAITHRATADRAQRDRVPAHPDRSQHGRGPRQLHARGNGSPVDRMPGRGGRRRAPAVRALHLGSTGKPKGVQHSTGGYLLWA